MAYYLFSVSVDRYCFDEVDPRILAQELSEGLYGEDPVFLEVMPEQMAETFYILVKGEIVTPKAKEVVTKYELD